MTWIRGIEGKAGDDIPVAHSPEEVQPVGAVSSPENRDFGAGLMAAATMCRGMGPVDVVISGSRAENPTMTVELYQPNPVAGVKLAD
jgi:hypothetical protein